MEVYRLMSNEPNSIVIEGQLLNVADVDTSNVSKSFREAWRLGDGNVVEYDSASLKVIMGGLVQVECKRRLDLGFNYDFGDVRGVHKIGTTDRDMRGWDEVTSSANALIALGNPSTTITIVTDTGPAVVTALEWMSILVAATAWRQPIWAASFALQASDPVSPNYDNNTHWPVGSGGE